MLLDVLKEHSTLLLGLINLIVEMITFRSNW